MGHRQEAVHFFYPVRGISCACGEQGNATRQFCMSLNCCNNAEVRLGASGGEQHVLQRLLAVVECGGHDIESTALFKREIQVALQVSRELADAAYFTAAWADQHRGRAAEDLLLGERVSGKQE